ncbi:hypothetical protein [Bordetella avium]|uniref:Membrane protein n=1 Tax=Bordetella avium (strain 197N) TaxID=360910 RepID=Q2KZR1_BORA1|nr:hypothetical protein [Bordetella avium]AZY49363.1 hypothetical protein C0J09_09580 [Bordetella avium]AZY52716.1 hypothetical protein C0J07_09565 [Bordetella avium]RIQ12841.1 hypothetical protein D0432_12320 [Bordetella avium]RIQ19124.1 hypothetical protein D0850_03320 [Bordetella avium]RIQ32035.1 hypothetical protein D0849_13625 [Bordetella avium]
MNPRPHFWFVWRAPLYLGLLTLFGLLSALLGTGIWHWASWIALSWLLLVMGWHWLRQPQS